MKKFKVYPHNGIAPAFWTTGRSKYAVQCEYYGMVTVYTEEEAKKADEYRKKVESGEIVETFID
jgi:hypothetical protein